MKILNLIPNFNPIKQSSEQTNALNPSIKCFSGNLVVSKVKSLYALTLESYPKLS